MIRNMGGKLNKNKMKEKNALARVRNSTTDQWRT